MDAGNIVIIALSLLLAVLAAVAVVVLHRRHVGGLRRQLRDAEDSRLDLAATAAVLHRRLAEADQALSILPTLDDALPGSDRAQRRVLMERALAAAAPGQASWEDTHPLTIPGFMQTRPAELDETPPR
jgi:hypothetical protein